jgi:hypothetical protein
MVNQNIGRVFTQADLSPVADVVAVVAEKSGDSLGDWQSLLNFAIKFNEQLAAAAVSIRSIMDDWKNPGPGGPAAATPGREVRPAPPAPPAAQGKPLYAKFLYDMAMDVLAGLPDHYRAMTLAEAGVMMAEQKALVLVLLQARLDDMGSNGHQSN